MNVYGLRLSFAQWVEGQGDISNDDHENVRLWRKDMTARFSVAFADYSDYSIAALVDLVCE